MCPGFYPLVILDRKVITSIASNEWLVNVPYVKNATACSCMFSPTPGRSILDGIPIFFSTSLLPIPESSRICGDLSVL